MPPQTPVAPPTPASPLTTPPPRPTGVGTADAPLRVTMPVSARPPAPTAPVGDIRWEANPQAAVASLPTAAAAAGPQGGAPSSAPDTSGIQWEDNPHAILPGGPLPHGRTILPTTGPHSVMLDTVLPIVSEGAMAMMGGAMAPEILGATRAGATILEALGTRAVGAGVGGAMGRAYGTQGSVTDAAKAGAQAALPDAAGEGIIAPALSNAYQAVKSLPVRAFGSYLKNRMSTEASQAAQFVGGKVLPGQISDSPFVQFMDNIAGATFGRGRYRQVFQQAEENFTRQAEGHIADFGPKATPSEAGRAVRGGLVKEAEQTGAQKVQLATRRGQEIRAGEDAAQAGAQDQVSQAEAALQRITDRFGPVSPVEQVGKGSQGLIEAAHSSADQAQSALYNDLWTRTKTQGIDISGLRARGEALAGEAGDVGHATGVQGRAGRSIGALTTPPPEPQALASAVPGYDAATRALAVMNPADPRRFKLEQELTTIEHTFGLSASGESAIPTPQQVHRLRSFYGRMSRATTGPESGAFKQLFAAADDALASGLAPKDLAQYRQATAMHAAMVDKFEEGALAKVVEAHPSQAVKAMLGAPGSVSDVTLARETLGDAGWKPVQARVWADVTQHPNGMAKTEKELLTELKGWTPEELTAVFGDEGAGQVRAAAGKLPDAAAARDTLGGTAGAKAADKAVEDAMGEAAAGVSAAQKQRVYTLVNKALKPASPEEVTKLRALVGEDGWKQVQSLELQRILGREGEDAVGVASPGQLRNKLNSRGERLPAIFDADTTNFLHQFARVRTQLAKKDGMGGVGKMAIQLQTPHAAAKIVTSGAALVGLGASAGAAAGGPNHRVAGAAIGGPGLILLTPYILARIATSPTLQRTLIGAMTATARDEAGTTARLTSNLTTQLVREGIIPMPAWMRQLGFGPPLPIEAPTGRGPGPRAQGPPAPPVRP